MESVVMREGATVYVQGGLIEAKVPKNGIFVGASDKLVIETLVVKEGVCLLSARPRHQKPVYVPENEILGFVLPVEFSTVEVSPASPPAVAVEPESAVSPSVDSAPEPAGEEVVDVVRRGPVRSKFASRRKG